MQCFPTGKEKSLRQLKWNYVKVWWDSDVNWHEKKPEGNVQNSGAIIVPLDFTRNPEYAEVRTNISWDWVNAKKEIHRK